MPTETEIMPNAGSQSGRWPKSIDLNDLPVSTMPRTVTSDYQWGVSSVDARDLASTMVSEPIMEPKIVSDEVAGSIIPAVTVTKLATASEQIAWLNRYLVTQVSDKKTGVLMTRENALLRQLLRVLSPHTSLQLLTAEALLDSTELSLPTEVAETALLAGGSQQVDFSICLINSDSSFTQLQECYQIAAENQISNLIFLLVSNSAPPRRHSQKNTLVETVENFLTASECRVSLLEASSNTHCTRCDNCSPTPETQLSNEQLKDARTSLDHGFFPISLLEESEPATRLRGKSLTVFGALGWSQIVSEALQDADQGKLPEALVIKLKKELLTSYFSTFSGIVAVSSQRRPSLVKSLTLLVSASLNIPILGVLHRQYGEELPQELDSTKIEYLYQPATKKSSELQGQKVLLIDDYIVTGNSISAASLQLLSYGELSVECFVLAQAI